MLTGCGSGTGIGNLYGDDGTIMHEGEWEDGEPIN